MTTFVNITAGQKANITDDGGTLVPREMNDGTFVVNAAVLTDPLHADNATYLATLPTLTLDQVLAIGFPEDG